MVYSSLFLLNSIGLIVIFKLPYKSINKLLSRRKFFLRFFAWTFCFFILLNIKNFVIVHIVALEYFFEIRSGSKLTKTNSSPSSKFVSLFNDGWIVLFQLVILIFHTTHSYNGAIEHLFQHRYVIFKLFEFWRFFNFIEIGLFFKFIIDNFSFEDFDFILKHQVCFVKKL